MMCNLRDRTATETSVLFINHLVTHYHNRFCRLCRNFFSRFSKTLLSPSSPRHRKWGMTFFIPQTRPLLEIRRDLHHHPYNHDLASKAPKSAGYGDNHASIVFPHGLAAAVAASATATTAPSSPLSSAPPRLIPPFTPTSAGPLFTSGNSAFTQFSLPPPMPHPSLAGLPLHVRGAFAAAATADGR